MFAARQDYRAFYEREIALRKAASYPPFSDIYQLVISDPDEALAFSSAKRCVEWLRKKLPAEVHVLGPAPGVLVKASGMYRFQLLIKAPAGGRRAVSLAIRQLRDKYTAQKGVAQLFTTDINPYSFL